MSSLYEIGKNGKIRRRKVCSARRIKEIHPTTCAQEHRRVPPSSFDAEFIIVGRDEMFDLGICNCMCPEPEIVKITLGSIFRYVKDEVKDWWATQNREPPNTVSSVDIQENAINV